MGWVEVGLKPSWPHFHMRFSKETQGKCFISKTNSEEEEELLIFYNNVEWERSWAYEGNHHQPLQRGIFSLGWCGLVDWVPSCKPQGYRFDSQSGHIPVRIDSGQVPSRGCSRGNDSLMFLSLSLPLPVKTNKYNLKKIKRGYFKKEKEHLRAKNVVVCTWWVRERVL